MKIFEVSPKELAQFLADKILSMDEDDMYKELKSCGFLKDNLEFEEKENYKVYIKNIKNTSDIELKNIDYFYMEDAA